MKDILISEWIKFRKNWNFFIYCLVFLLAYTIFSFTIHLTRVGSSGNLMLPINITYSGYIFYFGFFFSFFMFSLFIDSDIKEEIHSNKIYFILTQSIKRKDYFRGKVLFWFIIMSIWLFFLYGISLVYASLPFPRTPLLINSQYLSFNLVLLNSLVQFILMLPFLYFLLMIVFSAGYFFRLTSASIVFYILIMSFSLFIPMKTIDKFLIPFSKMRIYNMRISKLYIFDSSLLIYLITVILLLFFTYLIINKNLHKREM